RRARLLDLGDQRGAAFAMLRFQRGAEAARRRGVGGPRLHLRQRQGRLRGRDLLPLIGLDAAQYVAHGLFSRLETWARSSSTDSAEPLSTAWAAIPTPSARLRARPATT